MNHELTNIDFVETGSTACKSSGVESIDLARAVRKSFSAELSLWQQISIHPLLCASPNVAAKST